MQMIDDAYNPAWERELWRSRVERVAAPFELAELPCHRSNLEERIPRQPAPLSLFTKSMKLVCDLPRFLCDIRLAVVSRASMCLLVLSNGDRESTNKSAARAPSLDYVNFESVIR